MLPEITLSQFTRIRAAHPQLKKTRSPDTNRHAVEIPLRRNEVLD
jgi:hypothetical protein